MTNQPNRPASESTHASRRRFIQTTSGLVAASAAVSPVHGWSNESADGSTRVLIVV
ncbi:twin-arginine translocation signal domain-containing protein, partial [Rhodopirellula bahusiensis]